VTGNQVVASGRGRAAGYTADMVGVALRNLLEARGPARPRLSGTNGTFVSQAT